MKSFKDFLTENIKSEVTRVFSNGPGGIKKKLDWREDNRSAEFITKKGDRATIIFRGKNFVVYDNKKKPGDPGHKLVDSTRDPEPMEALYTIVWGIN